MIRLYTTLYNENDKWRRKELITSLRKNCELSAIDRIYILNEGGDISDLAAGKIEVINIQNRPTYQDFFALINQLTSSEDINIIANTDIYFDRHIAVLNYLGFTNHACLALSRWNFNSNGQATLFNRNDSQDVWVFQGKIRNVNANFPTGIPFCDNRILYELQQAGYRVLNPAFSIKTYHLHTGDRSEYDKRTLKQFVDEPYRYLYPHNYFNLPKTLYFNLTHPYKLQPYQYDIKKMNRWIIIRLIRKFLDLFFNKKMKLIGYK